MMLNQGISVYILLPTSCLLFILGLGFLWLTQRQKMKLKLDTRLALCTFDQLPTGAGTKSTKSELLPSFDNNLTIGIHKKGRLSNWVYIRRHNLRHQLAQSGFNRPSAEFLFYVCTILALMTGGILGLEMKIGIGLAFIDKWAAFFDMVFYAAIFSQFPALSLKAIVRKRKEELEQHVPDLIDFLVLCIGTGMTLEASMRKSTTAIGNLSPALSSEMKMMLNDLRVLPDKSSAFANLQNRTLSDGLKYLFMALYQSEVYGTSVAATLRTVATNTRKKRMIFLENAAARLPVLMSLPLILFILPPVIAISAGPGFILMLRSIDN